MALTKGSSVLATDYNSVRTRIVAEFNTTNRRNVSSYTAPVSNRSSGQSASAANVTAMAHDMYIVNSNTYTKDNIVQGEKVLNNINGVVKALTGYEGYPKVGTNSGCKSGCIGLCQGCKGGCQTGCTSCSDTCKDGCKGACKNTCDGCSDNCTSCYGDCTGSCSGCSGGCSGSCLYDCAATCTSGAGQ